MKSRFKLGRGAAILACAATLAGAAAAAPATAVARAAESCGSRAISVPQKGGKALKVPVSRIRVEGGATCKEAYAVIRGELTNNGPEGWSYGRGNFKVPHGLIAQIATNRHKKVKWATVGG